MLPNPTWYPQVYGRNTPTVLNNQQPTQTPTVFVNGDQARQVDRIILENNGHSANLTEIEARKSIMHKKKKHKELRRSMNKQNNYLNMTRGIIIRI